MSYHFKYTLEPYKGPSQKHTCPSCNHKKSFVRYIDTQTHQYHSDPNVGRCDREVKCKYHKKPGGNIHYKHKTNDQNDFVFNFVDGKYLEYSMQEGRRNFFVEFLYQKYPKDTVNKAVENYKIGSTLKKPGSTIFWQLDENCKIRTGKIMMYNPETGKRIKSGNQNHISWVHKFISLNEDFSLRQCLFGLHLAIGNDLPLAIVESEKTAVIGSIELPNYVWLATGSKNGLNKNKFHSIRYRDITFFPDLGCMDDWKKDAKKLNLKSNPTWVKLLEDKQNEPGFFQGMDIADYLLM